MILLVVLALLTLFAAVGLAFVIYSQSEADASRIFRESQNANINQVAPDDLPESLLALFLGQAVWGVSDEGQGIYSALRGHEMSRGVYGLNYTVNADGSLTLANNTAPFNGTGRLHYASALGLDDFNLINYTYYPSDPFLRDPERYATRPGPRATGTADNRGAYVGGLNPPYTYPDFNTMCVAAVKADGTVLMPSYFRPWGAFGPLDPNNWRWTSDTDPNTSKPVPGLKYQVLRPRPVDNPSMNGKPGFPLPADVGGDVKNLPGGKGYNGGQNDSTWTDLGLLVETLPDGRKYKPLFAALWVPLDNRINLNVVGNIRGQNSGQASNSGWGAWEINPRQLVDPNDTQAAAKQKEWANVFLGSGSVAGRYGSDNQPSSAGSSSQAGSSGSAPHFYAQVDYDGCNEQSQFTASGPILLPGTSGAPAQIPFASYLSYPAMSSGTFAGYGNGSPQERKNHPSLFNYFQPGGDDRVFDVSNMKALLRDGSIPIDPLSDMARLCPTNFGDGRMRRLVTLLSFDLDRPGLTPWVWDPASTNYSYQLATGTPYPTGAAMPFPTDSSYAPTPATAGASPPAGSEFGQDWKATFGSVDYWKTLEANLGPLLGGQGTVQVDLNRTLPDYPALTYTNGTPNQISDLNGFQAAQLARQQLAGDIFMRLVKVTGAFDLINASAAPSAQQFDALRWLAQLSANMVDYIDSDDYITPFNWTALGNGTFKGSVATLDPQGKGWVFGTEVPRLVLNEAYVEVDNDPNPVIVMGKTTVPYKVNFWVELHNPFSSDNTLAENGAARLQMPGYPVYQLVISDTTTADSTIRQAGNVFGDPDPSKTKAQVLTFAPEPLPTTQPTGDYTTVQPASGGFSGTNGKNEGFYVLGPKADFPGTDTARPVASLRLKDQTVSGGRSSMVYEISQDTTNLAALPQHSLYLRRLACPYLQPQTDPNQANYNPYITVDYMAGVPAMSGVTNTGANGVGPVTPPAFTSRYSVGRNQPYAAGSWWQKNQAPATTYTKQPQNTFFRQNAVETSGPPNASATNQTLKVPFDWLVHLDRQLISPMELLQVSAFKPHELTQQFMTMDGSGNTQTFQQVAPWFDPTARLYRSLELLKTRSRAAGMAAGGRIPGKIDINNIWDVETFLALCDAQSSNSFSRNDALSVYNTLMGLRTPTVDGNGNHVPGATDQPFWGLATGNYPGADAQYPGFGINNTMLRSGTAGGGPSTARLFQTSGNHPYLQNQLLTKIFNDLTIRSNVYALWLTVGFFEVNDDSAQPVKLGDEIGKSTAQNVRHHMFAVVDRSALTEVDSNTPSTTSNTGVTAPGPVTISPAQMSGTNWSIQAGSILTVDTGTAQETVLVTAVDTTKGTFTAKFSKTHAGPQPGPVPGFTIYIPQLGNPGPQPQFTLRDNSAVVPYYLVID